MSDTDKPVPPPIAIDVDQIDLDSIESVAIRRIVEEMRADKTGPSPSAYNRVYSRHNR